jgi:flagellar biosynthesis/type III secretory pathway protein FliH
METLAMTIQKIFPTQIEPGSIADQYIKKGRQEGIQEGLKEGEIQLIHTLQDILGVPLTDASNFQDHSLEQLQAITIGLRQQIRARK